MKGVMMQKLHEMIRKLRDKTPVETVQSRYYLMAIYDIGRAQDVEANQNICIGIYGPNGGRTVGIVMSIQQARELSTKLNTIIGQMELDGDQRKWKRGDAPPVQIPEQTQRDIDLILTPDRVE
jgi:hypothetical protein